MVNTDLNIFLNISSIHGTPSSGGADTFSDQSNTLIRIRRSDWWRETDHCFTELVPSGWARVDCHTCHTMVTCHSLSSLLSHYLYIFVWVSYVHSIKVSRNFFINFSNFPTLENFEMTLFSNEHMIYTWT